MDINIWIDSLETKRNVTCRSVWNASVYGDTEQKSTNGTLRNANWQAAETWNKICIRCACWKPDLNNFQPERHLNRLTFLSRDSNYLNCSIIRALLSLNTGITGHCKSRRLQFRNRSITFYCYYYYAGEGIPTNPIYCPARRDCRYIRSRSVQSQCGKNC